MVTHVGIFAVLVSLFVAGFSGRKDASSMIYYLLIALYHIAFSLIFYSQTLDVRGDANDYYDYGSMFTSAMPISTELITRIAYFLREDFGATYLDEFLVFQLFGLIGIILILKTLATVGSGISGAQKAIFVIIAFSPGLHIWSVSIGKDGLLLMSLGLICNGLSGIRINRYYVFFGLLIAFWVRPHVGIFYLFSVIVSVLVLSAHVAVGVRAIAIIAGLAAMVFGAVFAADWLGIGDLSQENVSGILDRAQAGNATAGSAIDIENLIFPLRLAAFLFLPLFFDSTNLNSLVLSVDNAILLSLFVYCIYNMKQIWIMSRHRKVVSFGFVAFPILTAFLSIGASNVGLAARQKMMVVPILPILYCAAHAVRRSERAPKPAVVRDSLGFR